MATYAFHNIKLVCTPALTDVYTCPSTNGNGNVSATIVFNLQAANVSNIADVITVVWTDSSNGNAATRLTFLTPIAPNQSIGCLTGRLILEPGDKIRAQCQTNGSVELTGSIMETI